MNGKDWYEHHMEEFVRPHLGSIPNIDPDEYYLTHLSKKALSALRAHLIEARRRAAGRTILLPGRDVFLLEIIARMEGWPTIFRPELSSDVRSYPQVVGQIPDLETLRECYVVDTGFRGSVPRALGCQHWGLVSYAYPQGNTLEEKAVDKRVHQLFPRFTCSSPIGILTSTMEGCPKYWRRAVARPKDLTYELVQDYSDLLRFKRAAMITQYVIGYPYKPRTFLGKYFDGDHYWKTLTYLHSRGRDLQGAKEPDPVAPVAPPTYGFNFSSAGSAYVSSSSSF